MVTRWDRLAVPFGVNPFLSGHRGKDVGYPDVLRSRRSVPSGLAAHRFPAAGSAVRCWSPWEAPEHGTMVRSSVRWLLRVLAWKAPPAVGAAFIGVLLGLAFGSLTGEGIDPAAPAYGSTVFLLIMTVGWGMIGGIAFSRRLGFPPAASTTADWVWQGGLRGGAAGVAAITAWILCWLLLDLGGSKGGLGADGWEALGFVWGFALVGFFLGALFALAIKARSR